MRAVLTQGEENNPAKATVESVLPGVHQQFTNLYNEINRVRLAIAELKEEAGSANIDGETEIGFLLCWHLILSSNIHCCFFPFFYSAPNEGAFGGVFVASE
jgi:hypothetical protein